MQGTGNPSGDLPMRVQAVVLTMAALQLQGPQYPSCNNRDLAAVPMKMRILPNPGAHVTGDAFGDYAHDRSRCTSVPVSEGLFRFGTATRAEWPECQTATREMTVDLTHPVDNGGGISQGVMVGTNYMKVYAISSLNADGKLAGLHWMPVGQTVPAFWAKLEFTDKATGTLWSVTFNPDPQICAHAYSAPGSTRASITRTSDSHWQVDLPAGSIGRLYRGISPSTGGDRGLFYIQAHFAIELL